MKKDKDIERLLKKIKGDDEEDLSMIYNYIGKKNMSVDYFLSCITANVYDEKSVLAAISFFPYNINVECDNGYNIVQNAINAGYSEDFVFKLLIGCSNKSLDNKLDINHVDDRGNTILHSAIYSERFKGNILKMFKLMLNLGFDYSIRNTKNKTIVDSMKTIKSTCDKYSDKELEEVVELYDKIEATKPEIERLRKEKTRELPLGEKIRLMLDTLEGNEHNDYHIIKSFCDKEFLKLKDLLYCLSTRLYEGDGCLFAVRSLVYNDVDINYVPNNGMNSFFQNLVENGYGYKFIFDVLHYVAKMKKMNVDLNYKNKDGDTFAFSVANSGIYNEEQILAILYEAKKYGCDVSIKNADGKDVFEVIDAFYHGEEAEFFPVNTKSVEIDPEKLKEIEKYVKDNLVAELNNYGKVLTSKKYLMEPIYGRKNELKNLMVTLAQDKKNPIIVGESGVGKTALVEELAYKIVEGEVPGYLKNKIIFEVNPSELVSGCKYVGQFEEKMKNIFDLVLESGAILFIDEIHTIYGVGTTEFKSSGLESMIKQFVDRNDVKIIGTTTEEEYEEYFSQDALKRRFEKIKVKEPDDELLKKIISKVIDDYCSKSALDFSDKGSKRRIVEALVFATDKSHRVYNDVVNNPDLAIAIIDKAFAFAKYNDQDNIDEMCFIESLRCCDRIYETTRENAISMLRKKEVIKIKNKGAKILDIDFIKKSRR